jgi:hypothetical protein
MSRNYYASKILSLGSLHHKLIDDNVFLLPTTNTPARTAADIRDKYRKYKQENAPYREYYDIIDKVGLDNLTYKIIKAEVLQTKEELNNLLIKTQLERDALRTPAPPPPTVEELIAAADKSKVGDITLKKYVAVFRKLMERLDTDNPLFYRNTGEVIDYITNKSELALNTQLNYFKALIFLIPKEEAAYNEYHEVMMNKIKEAEDQRGENMKSAIQTKKWRTYEEILTIHNNLKKTAPKSREFIISCFYSGVYFPPWRLLELTELKIANYDEKIDNYIDEENQMIVLNRYKTVKAYGRIEQKIPAELMNYIVEYIDNSGFNFEKDSYLFTPKLAVMKLNRILNDIYGCSVDILRSSYITHLFETGALKTKKKMNETAEGMRHSVNMLLEYRKI